METRVNPPSIDIRVPLVGMDSMGVVGIDGLVCVDSTGGIGRAVASLYEAGMQPCSLGSSLGDCLGRGSVAVPVLASISRCGADWGLLGPGNKSRGGGRDGVFTVGDGTAKSVRFATAASNRAHSVSESLRKGHQEDLHSLSR